MTATIPQTSEKASLFQRSDKSEPIQVMISYSSEDRAIGDAACEVLESRGLRCWIAPRDILPGRDWGAAIMGAIRAARVLVLIYTSNSNDSLHVRREVERAVALGLHVIPVRVENVPMSPTLEYFISAPHWLDAIMPPLGQHLERLADNIHELLGSHHIQPPPTPVPAVEVSPAFAAIPSVRSSRTADTLSRVSSVFAMTWKWMRKSPPARPA